MSDLISRQAAIDAIFSEPLYKYGMKKRDADVVVPAIYEKIKSLPPVKPEKRTETHACDLISRQAVLDMAYAYGNGWEPEGYCVNVEDIHALPSAQPEYKPVTAEDFAKTMSENTLYGFMAWHDEALALMKEQGFVICKKMPLPEPYKGGEEHE